MKRSDRAALVIAEIESRGATGEQVTPAMIEDVIRRNALGEHELRALHREVLRAMDERGYEVELPIKPWPWALAGVVGLLLWVLLVWGVYQLLSAL